ncbi:MAG: helix-turn-helix transcriptional regulator [Sphingomonas sp.]|nr:helix-turn-helix transcriptional regulator [Sphingomonas sp.]
MNDNTSAIFPQRLKAARDKRELSQGDLAKAAKLPASSISHFESGARKPSFDNLKRLATALNVSTDFLVGRVEQMDSVGPAEVIHRHLENLSSKDVELATDFIKMLGNRGKHS